MAQILNYNYMNFRRYLKRRDEVGYDRAIMEFKRDQAEGILDCIVSAGPHQGVVTPADCIAISRYVDTTYNPPTATEEMLAFLNGTALLSLDSAKETDEEIST